MEFLHQFGHRIAVDSYGECAQTRAPADMLTAAAVAAMAPADVKRELMRRYKFTLSIENSRCDDYVTEKFYDVFRTPSLLLYLGAPNIAEYAPGPRSFVDIQGGRAALRPRERVARIHGAMAAHVRLREAAHACDGLICLM
jgi:hypothetical protein